MKKTFSLAILLIIPTIFFSQKTEMTFLDGDFKPTKKKDLCEYYRKVIKTDTGYYVRDYYINDLLKMSGLFSDKELKINNGYFVWYFEDGIKNKEANFVEGMYHGTELNYYENGKIKSSEFFRYGKSEGVFVSYFKNGNVAKKFETKNSLIEGQYDAYYPDGTIYAKAQFLKGNIVGEAERSYSNQQIMTKIKVDEFGNGFGILYYDDGKIKEKVYFLKGKIKDTIDILDKESTQSKNVTNQLKTSKGYDDDIIYGSNDATNYFYKEPFNVESEGVVAELPEKDAEYDGGPSAMQKYISQNVRYPKKAIKYNIEGKVYVSFIVEIDGGISNVVIEKGSKVFHEEVMRLIKNMPNWIPGEVNGKKVRARCRLPINFTLN
jgi:TonB family protein